MERWRSARDAGEALSVAEQDELDHLVKEETFAATARAHSLLGEFAE
jgi:hypothetical protein